jgi:hypothetical protein
VMRRDFFPFFPFSLFIPCFSLSFARMNSFVFLNIDCVLLALEMEAVRTRFDTEYACSCKFARWWNSHVSRYCASVCSQPHGLAQNERMSHRNLQKITRDAAEC